MGFKSKWGLTLHLTVHPLLSKPINKWEDGSGGVLPDKLSGGGPPASQNPYPIYDLTRNSAPYSMTVAAGTVALNIIYEGLLMMALSIMMKK